jgi:hypothetical protein
MIVDRDTPDISIQRWELPGTQHDMPRVAIPVQTVTTTRSNNTTDVSGDLNLPFREFVGRDIDPNSVVERDLGITRQRLSMGINLEKKKFSFHTPFKHTYLQDREWAKHSLLSSLNQE